MPKGAQESRRCEIGVRGLVCSRPRLGWWAKLAPGMARSGQCRLRRLQPRCLLSVLNRMARKLLVETAWGREANQEHQEQGPARAPRGRCEDARVASRQNQCSGPFSLLCLPVHPLDLFKAISSWRRNSCAVRLSSQAARPWIAEYRRLKNMLLRLRCSMVREPPLPIARLSWSLPRRCLLQRIA